MSQVATLTIGTVTFALGVLISFFFQNLVPACIGLGLAILLEVVVALRS